MESQTDKSYYCSIIFSILTCVQQMIWKMDKFTLQGVSRFLPSSNIVGIMKSGSLKYTRNQQEHWKQQMSAVF
jgi:hypothetical protein